MARVLKIHRGDGGKKSRRVTTALIILFLLLVLILVLNSSVFTIKQVNVSGNKKMSAEEIKAEFGVDEGMNLFRYFINYVGHSFSISPRLDAAEVFVHWPNQIEIVVEESVTIGYVYFQGTYLCLSKNGYVVDSTYHLEEDLPVIKGLSVGSFTLGETLSTKDTERYQLIVTIGAVLQKYGLSERVTEIDVRDMEDIILYTENLEIWCGSREDIDIKIATVDQVLKANDSISGILHAEDLSKQVYIEDKL